MQELVFLATCNRVEVVFHAGEQSLSDEAYVSLIAETLCNHGIDVKDRLKEHASVYKAQHAVRHLFEVASSLDSLVVGEREIITQVRKAFEQCLSDGLCGEMLKVLMRKTIEAAKRVFSETHIAARPVSVVSLAFRHFKQWDLPLNSRILVIGAGETNTALLRFMHKAGWRNITIYNRTLANGQRLADELGCKAKTLTDLEQHQNGFDVLVTCTGATQPIMTAALWGKLSGDNPINKHVIDLAIPADVEENLIHELNHKYLGVPQLKPIAEENLRLRAAEMESCRLIIAEELKKCEQDLESRKVELAMRNVPEKVKEIKRTALESVFSKEISTLDDNAKEVLEKVLAYMEKKYISVPMKMAREIIVEQKMAAE